MAIQEGQNSIQRGMRELVLVRMFSCVCVCVCVYDEKDCMPYALCPVRKIVPALVPLKLAPLTLPLACPTVRRWPSTPVEPAGSIAEAIARTDPFRAATLAVWGSRSLIWRS